MKKQLIAAAVASAFVTPVTMAQETATGIQVYGRAQLSAGWLHDGEDGGLNTSSNSSRLGFRVNHDLGNNLRAVAQIEQEVRWDNGTGSFASRDTFAGLQGGFGLIRLGHFDTPLKLVRSNTDFFGDYIGDARNLTRMRDGYTGGDFDFDTRFRNGVHYRSPVMGGVIFDLHYSTNTDAGVNIDGDNSAWSGSVSYNQDGLYLAGSWERKEETKSDAMRFGAGYTMGDFRVAGLAQFATIKDSTLIEDQDVNTFGLGVSYRIASSVTLKGQYYWLTADGDERDASMIAAGVDYQVARPFRLLFAYALTSNDDNAVYTMSGGGHGARVAPAAPGENPNGFSVGFRYDF